MEKGRSWTEICTDYRAIAHIVEALVMLYILIILSQIGLGFTKFHLIYLVYTKMELAKGSILLYAIKKENKKFVYIYLCFDGITLIVKYVLVIAYMKQLSGSLTYDVDHDSYFYYKCMISTIFFVICYEAILFAFVFKFIKELEDRNNAQLAEATPANHVGI